MSTLQLNGFGPASDVVSLVPLPPHSPGDDEVLVEMEVATINTSDFLLVNGTYAVRPNLPAGIGAEGVGRVVTVGTHVDHDLVGRRVVLLPTYGHGTWATHVLARRDAVLPVPDNGDPLQLAMIGINPMTAKLMLEDHLGAGAGTDVLVGQSAGSSAVGEYVVKLAALAGHRTLSVVRRAEAAEQVRSWGGDVVLVDGPDLPAALGAALGDERLALVVDGAGGPVARALAERLRFRGTLVSYAVLSGELAAASLPALVFGEVRLTGMWLMNWLRSAPAAEVQARYGELAELVGSGRLTARIDRTYRLDDWQEAFAHAQSYDRSGKVLFDFR